MATSPAPVPAGSRRTPWTIALAGLAAFVATLVIPAIAALWWLLAAVTVVSVLSVTVTGVRLRRVSPEAGAGPGR